MKTIILLPLLLMIGACSGINSDFLKSKTTAPIEEKSTAANKIVAQRPIAPLQRDVILDTNITSTKALTAHQQAGAKLKESGVSFVLYFPYDEADISEENTKSIIEHANFMRNNPTIKLRLEGHADERGTREYNLALGENRALSIKEILGLYGLNGRAEVISFGEEKPVSNLHNEEAWQQNRRVEFIYQ